jgi:hypothetical protein
VPEIDYKVRKEAIQAALVEMFAPEVKGVYKKRPTALNKDIYSGVFSYEMPYQERYLIVADLTEEQIESVLEPYTEENAARTRAKVKLEELVMGCSTRKQLVNAAARVRGSTCLAEASTGPQPTSCVANVIADMTKLGWPKK